MGQNPNTQLINFDWNEPMKSLWVQVDRDRVRQLGVSSKPLVEALNAVTGGMIITQVRDSILSDRPGGSVTGYTIEAGATIEETAKGLSSIVAVFPVMIMLMLTILMVQLQSFQKMFLVISVAPLGLIGVLLALLPTGTPMGFVAILGIIALSGMIIRNSVILIDQIDMDLARGLHPWDAVIDATTNRLRPIVLTAAAAALGMIPSRSALTRRCGL